MQRKKITLIATEASGDKHAAKIIREITSVTDTIDFSGIGGKLMQKCGVDILFDLTSHSVTGATEVVKQLPVFYKAIQTIKQHLKKSRPDLLILVDSPSFNLRIAPFAKSLGIQVFYYISPQIWAWNKKRIELIKNTIDMMAVILPFEKEIYKKAGVAVRFVGHPLTDITTQKLDINNTKQLFNLSTIKQTIALLPGSRANEIHRLLPIMKDVASRLYGDNNNYQFIIPRAPNLSRDLFDYYLDSINFPLKVVEGNTVDVVNCSDFAIVASGTASLECALLEKPMVIVYKASKISYVIASQVVKVKFLGLCNLLANSMIVPELLQDDCNAENIYYTVTEILSNDTIKNKMKSNLSKVRHSLTSSNIDCTFAQLVLEHI
jgi:lipid-A-disaccharide synthase